MSPGVLIYPGAGLGPGAYRSLLRALDEARMSPAWVHSRRGGADLLADAAAAREMAAESGPVIVVGHSMGGFAAESAARCHPDSVAGVVLLDGSTLPDHLAGEVPRSGRPGADVTVAEVAASRSAASEPGEVRPDSRARRGRGIALPGPLRRWRDDLGRFGHDAEAMPLIRGEHGLPDVQVTVVSAAWTGRAPWDVAWLGEQKRLADLLERDHPRGAAGVRRHELRPCGHALMWWRPRECAALIGGVTG